MRTSEVATEYAGLPPFRLLEYLECLECLDQFRSRYQQEPKVAFHLAKRIRYSIPMHDESAPIARRPALRNRPSLCRGERCRLRAAC